jgi:uncharacterized delta-60 repeat protein
MATDDGLVSPTRSTPHTERRRKAKSPHVGRFALIATTTMFLGLFWLPLNSVAATPGALDTTFSGDGKQMTDFGTLARSTDDRIQGVRLQGDGKIVAVGCTDCETFTDWAVTRYSPGGTLDPTFSGDGVVILDWGCCFGQGDDYANDVAIQADGKIVVAGMAQIGTGHFDFALARFNSDGTPDSTFDLDGQVTTDFAKSGGLDDANEVAIQGDGKIVVAGRAETSTGGSVFALARYAGDGSLDSSFGGDGRVTTNFGGPVASAQALLILPSGKLVAVGADRGDFAVARYRPNGSLDPNFSSDGKVLTNFGGASDSAADVAVQSDGKLLVAGQAGSYGATDFAVARYRLHGALDRTFSGDGKQRTDFWSDTDSASGIALQSNGKTVLAGLVTYTPPNPDFGLARYRADGRLDPTFSRDGKVRTDFAKHEDFASDIVIRGGKILAVGAARAKGPSGGNDYNFALARYLTT